MACKCSHCPSSENRRHLRHSRAAGSFAQSPCSRSHRRNRETRLPRPPRHADACRRNFYPCVSRASASPIRWRAGHLVGEKNATHSRCRWGKLATAMTTSTMTATVTRTTTTRCGAVEEKSTVSARWRRGRRGGRRVGSW